MVETELQRILRGRDIKTIAKEMGLACWVAALAPWDTYFTNTFRSGRRMIGGGTRHPGRNPVRWIDTHVCEAGAQKSFEHYWKKIQPGVPCIYGIDPNPSGDGGHHVHALAATSGGLYRKDAWEKWQELFGNARIVPVESIGGVSGYIAKYPLTGARWWNVMNCRQPAFGFS
jgi:hypothetical protein